MTDRLLERMKDDVEMETQRQFMLASNSREMERRLIERKNEDLTIPHKCDAAYIYYPTGADLEQIDNFTTELTEIVDKMKEELVKETRILEGTEVPVYQENELSQTNPEEPQWNSVLPNGSSTIDLIPTSTQDSSSSFSTADLFNQNCPIVRLRRQSTNSPISSCSETSGVCGTETDAMNECSECTVPMTSELMLGMPNEVK